MNRTKEKNGVRIVMLFQFITLHPETGPWTRSSTPHPNPFGLQFDARHKSRITYCHFGCMQVKPRPTKQQRRRHSVEHKTLHPSKKPAKRELNVSCDAAAMATNQTPENGTLLTS